jgi:hypothetical protein
MARTVFFAGPPAVSREIIVSRHFRHQRLIWHITPALRPMPGRGASWRGEGSLDAKHLGRLVLVNHHTATTGPQCVRMFWPDISLLIRIRPTSKDSSRLERHLGLRPDSSVLPDTRRKELAPCATTPGADPHPAHPPHRNPKGHRRAQRHLGLTHQHTHPTPTRKDTAMRNDTWG